MENFIQLNFAVEHKYNASVHSSLLYSNKLLFKNSNSRQKKNLKLLFFLRIFSWNQIENLWWFLSSKLKRKNFLCASI